MLDAYGKSDMTYFYYDVPGDFTAWLDGNDDEVEVGDVTLAAGEGLWVKAPDASYSLQTAGQVPTTGISVTLRNGFKLVVNSTPVAVDLTDIDVSGHNAEDGTVWRRSADRLGWTEQSQSHAPPQEKPCGGIFVAPRWAIT